MILKEKNLTIFNERIFKDISKDSSFKNYFSLLKETNYRFTYKFNYKKTTLRLEELKNIINVILSIINKPHFTTKELDYVLRSELSGKISTQSFLETIKDSKLWKNKDGVITPEFVHSIENVDTILTYENKFICHLINLMSLELDRINSELNMSQVNFENKFGVSSFTFNEYSLLSEMEKDSSLTAIFDNKPYEQKAKELLKYLKRKILQIKSTQFYKICNIKIDSLVLKTNIFLHNPLYNTAYKFYTASYMSDLENNELIDVYYFNYNFISLIKFLADKKILTSIRSTKTKIEIINNKIEFDDIKFKYKGFNFVLSTLKNINGFKFDVSFEDKKATYLLFTNYLLDENVKVLEEEYLSKNKIKANNKINVYVINELNEFNNVINLSLYKENHDVLFTNLLNSMTFLFKGNVEQFMRTCPICGHKNVISDGVNYECLSCFSIYTGIEDKRNKYIWIKNLRKD